MLGRAQRLELYLGPPRRRLPQLGRDEPRGRRRGDRLAALREGAADLRFAEPQFAVTPGQMAVLYDGDEVLGGGWIAQPELA